MRSRLFFVLVLYLGCLALLAILSSLSVTAQPPQAQTSAYTVAETRTIDEHSLSNIAAQTNEGFASAWLQVYPATSPPARDLTWLSYDSTRKRVVLFGGRQDTYVFLNDTWEWNGVNWIQRFPATSPSARSSYAMVYDSARKCVVVFGGFDGGWPTTTWEWDGTNWVERTTSISPGGRTGHAMAYDDARERVVFFGGFDANYKNDTWEWDGTNWAQRSPLISPSARAAHAMAHDSTRGVVVLFGGVGNSGKLNDTWEWNGTNWVQRSPLTLPPARSGHALIYDNTRRRIVLFGGAGLNDTWEWDGTNWTQCFPVTSPSARYGHGLAYDDSHREAILFGGSDSSRLNDTWTYEFVQLLASPTTRIISPGRVTTYSLTVEGSVSVTLTTSALPLGVTGQFIPSPNVTPPTQPALVLTTPSTLPDGIYPLAVNVQGDSLTATVRVTLTVATPDFGLVPFPASWTIHPGAVVTYSVALTASATYTAPVAMELSGLPTGVIGIFSPNPAPPPAAVGLRLTAAPSTVVGMYSLVITGTGTVFSGTTAMPLVHTVPVTLSVLSSGITSTVSPGSRTVYQGQPTAYTVAVTATPGLTQPATLAVNGLAGANTALWPNPVPLGGAATLVVTTTLDTLPRTTHFTVTATSSGLTGVAPATLIVLSANITPTVSPGSRTVYRGQSTSYAVNLAATPGFMVPAALEAGQLPDGTSYSFVPAAVSPGSSATLLVTTTAATPLGAYPLAITSTAGSLIRAAHATLEVKAGVYLPLICKRWPPIPFDPLLNAIDNADGDSTYTVYWTEQPSRLADTYTLQEATNAAFTTGLRDVCTTAQQYGVVSGKLAGTYYYRVRGHNTWGDSAWSNVQSATALLPDTPTLYAIDNADGDSNYVVSWSLAARAGSYTLQEDTSPSFSNPATVYAGASTSWPASGKAAGTYYYRVLASGGTGQSNWSATQSATVLLPNTPHLNPIDNADGDGNYVVSWNPAARATNYTLQEDTSPSFSNPATVYSGAATSWSASGKATGTYYYRVLASSAAGQSNWSATQSATVLPPAAPYLNPIDNADGDGNYNVVWNAAARATNYTLEEDTEPGFGSPTTLYTGAGLSWSVANQRNGTYYYRVKSAGPTGQSGWSNKQSVNVPPRVSVLNNHTTYRSGSYRYVVGEVYNNTPSYLRFVKITVNFFNGSQLVATDYTYTSLDNVHPYEKACFKIILDEPATWDHYTFEAPTYWTDGSARPNLVITTHSGGVYGTYYYRIIGQIRNDETVTIRFVSAVVTLYDAAGRVVGCDYAYVSSTDLSPGQVSSFEIYAMPPNPSAVASYVLQTDGMR